MSTRFWPVEAQSTIESMGIFASRRVLLTGRGATALCVLYKVLQPDYRRIILPAIGCPSILATALLSGLETVIVDVDGNLNIDPGEVEKAIKPGDIVLGVHIFGIPCQIKKLEKICREHNAFLIEDAAQAIGGFINGQPAGTFGDASILSFAAGKILETISGGAVLTDDTSLYTRLSSVINGLPSRPGDERTRSKLLRDNATDIFNRARLDNPSAASEWCAEFERSGDIYNFAIDEMEAFDVCSELQYLEEIRDMNFAGLQIFREALDIPGIRQLEYPDDCSPWRFSFILPDLSGTEVQAVTNEIRKAIRHASNLYLPLHWLAPDRIITEGCPNAEHAGLRIINLWLAEDFPERDALRVRKILEKMLK